MAAEESEFTRSPPPLLSSHSSSFFVHTHTNRRETTRGEKETHTSVLAAVEESAIRRESGEDFADPVPEGDCELADGERRLGEEAQVAVRAGGPLIFSRSR